MAQAACAPSSGAALRKRGDAAPAPAADHTAAPEPSSPSSSSARKQAFVPSNDAASTLTGLIGALDRVPEWPWIPLMLTAIAAVTRYWRIREPPGVVFDEHHFGRFTNQYWKGEYFFDIHPPLGKWGFLITAWLVGYDADVCDYTDLGTAYHPDCKFLPLRFTAAAFGVATVPLLYTAARLLGLGRWGAVLTASLFTFDMLNLIESRLILTDSQLMFWIVVCLTVGMFYFRRKQEHHAAEAVVLAATAAGAPRAAAAAALDAATVVPGAAGAARPGEVGALQDQAGDDLLGGVSVFGAYPRLLLLGVTVGGAPAAPPAPGAEPLKGKVELQVAAWPSTGAAPRLLSKWDNFLWCVGLGLACGASVSVKWTGLGTPGLVALETWLGLFFLPEPVAFLDMIVMLVTAFVFYVANYWVHFQLLPNTGDGDAFMKPEFQRTLIGNADYDPNAPKPAFIKTFFELAYSMLTGNAAIDVRHNWESTWDQWVLNQRGLLYNSNTTEPIRGRTESVYLIGNPAVIWFVFAIVVTAVLYLFAYYRCRSIRMLANTHVFRFNTPTLSIIGFTLVGYACNLLPYLSVKRSCFVYHYMPALMYGEILAGALVERFFRKGVGAARAVSSIMAVVLLVFVFYIPWIYSLPLTAEAHEQRRWLKSWD